MHPRRIDIHTPQERQIWDSNRGKPKAFFTQHTADAIHLCLYACHTVLQPIFDERHDNRRRIKSSTEDGMHKWVQRNFHWLRDVYMEKYGHQEMAKPLGLQDMTRLYDLIGAVMKAAGEGKDGR
jgi:hypothetical protein